MSYIVQSVLLSRDKFSKKEAFEWVRDHEYKADKVDVTNDYYRFRQMNPDLLHLYYFRTIKLGDIGHLVVAYPGKE